MSAILNTGFLSATYRQYKRDTEYIAGWLVETSRKIGFSPDKDAQASSAPVAESQRLKGKARKEAKVAAKATPGATKNKTSEYHIRTVDFVPIAEAIAEAIASQAKKVKVPSALLTLFGRAIKARREAQAWYKAAQLEDEGHGYFIDVLAKVQEILRPLVQPVAKVANKNGKAPATSSGQNGIENRFSHLTVEEAADMATKDDEKDTNLPSKLPPVVAAEIEQTDAEAEEEFFFAIHSFLKGIHEIQDVVQEAWFKRQDFNMDPLAAALLANTAIDLVRRAEGELDLLLKRPSKYPASKFPVWCLPALLYHRYHPLPDGVNIRDAVMPSDVSIAANEKDYDKIHANWCFWPVYSGLRFCVNRIKKYKYLEANEAELEAIGAHAIKDIKRTFDLAKEFRTYTLTHKRFWAQDEVTRGMKLMFADHCVPIWVVFGMQTLLDIQDINDYRMGEGSGHNVPYNHMRAEINGRLDEWDKFEDWKPPFEWAFGEGTHSEKERKLCKDIMMIYHDLIEHHDVPAVEFNPIRCGLIKYDLFLQSHTCGYYLERDSGFASVLGHLYTAGKLLYPDDPAWPDMEWLLYSQNPNHIFYGGIPKTLKEAYSKSGLAFGSKLKNPDKNANSKTFTFHKSSRLFDITSMLSPILEGRMTGWNTKHTNESVDKLANNLNAVLCDKGSQARLARQLHADPGWVEEEIYTRRQIRLFEDAPAEGPPALLRDLSLFLEGEMQDVYFDWITMYRICGDIWKEILKDWWADPALEKYMRQPNPGIGYWILKSAADDETKRGKICHDDASFAPQLRKIWACIQRVIHRPSSHKFIPFYEGAKAWLGDECLAQQMSRNGMTVAWQLVEDNVRQFAVLYKNWPVERKRSSGVLQQVTGHAHRNRLDRERSMDLQLFGLREPCDTDDEDHTERPPCGRCNRRNFFLERYGAASSLRGTELVEKHLSRKYHGKDEAEVDEDKGLKTYLRERFAERGIPFYDGDVGEGDEPFVSSDDEDADSDADSWVSGYEGRIKRTKDGMYQVEVDIRSMFSRPGLWRSLGS